MKRLLAFILVLLIGGPAVAWRSGTTDLTVLDKVLATYGPYGLFLNPQNPQGLNWWQYGSYSPAAFPNGNRIQWNWPLRAAPNVLAFLQVASYGDYYNTVPAAPITSRQVSAINNLTVPADVTHSGTTNGYSVLYDYFFTASPNVHGNLYEVELFLHSPQYAVDYINAGFVTQIGTTSISGITWQVAVDLTAFGGTQPIFLVAQSNYADVPKQTIIDLKALHSYLIAHGYAIGSLYYNGHSLGVEVGQGIGQLRANSVASVVYN